MATLLCQSTPALRFGVTRSQSTLVRFGVARSYSILLRFGVLPNSIGEPLDPYAVHLGGGVVQVYVTPPLSGTLKTYELQGSLDLAGPYTSIGIMSISPRDVYVYNIPTGLVIYLQIRAVSTDGSRSDWVQVRRGVADKCNVLMKLRSVVGSRIPAGALFTMAKEPARLIGFTSDDLVLF